MRSRIISAIVACVALASFLACAARGASPDHEIVIVHTNDVHCGVDDHIGYAGLAHHVAKARARTPYVALVDAGDAVQGGPIGTISQGNYIIEIMAALSYDVAVPGNHEFDYGMGQFEKFARDLPCGYVACNFRDERTGELVYPPYEILTFEGTRVAFVGVCTPESITKSSPSSFMDEQGRFVYAFDGGKDGAELIASVQGAVDGARSEGADFVILVAHLGEYEDVTEAWSAPYLAARTRGIDAIIDGHSHEVTPSLKIHDLDGKEVPIVQTGTKLMHFGELTIDTSGKITTRLIDTVDGKDEEIEALIQRMKDRYEGTLRGRIGWTSFDLRAMDDDGEWLVRDGETALCGLVTDALLAAASADLALINAGAIRADLRAGELTYGDALSVFPFGNTLGVYEVSGQALLDELEMGARLLPQRNGGLLHASGMSYVVDVGIPTPILLDERNALAGIEGPRRVRDVFVGGAPIDPARTYRVVSTNYLMLEGGDGHRFAGSRRVVEDFITNADALAHYIRSFPTIPESCAAPAGRLRIIERGQEGVSMDVSAGIDRPWACSGLIGLAATLERPSLKDDFYLAVDHEWLASVELKPGRARDSAFDAMQDDLDAALRAIMTDASIEGHDAELLRRLYALWLDWEARDAAGVDEILRRVGEVERVTTLDELTAYFKSEGCLLHGAGLAGFSIGVDDKDATSYNIELSATPLSLGDSAEHRELTPNGERTKKMRDAMTNYMLGRLGYEEARVRAIIDAADAFEAKLAPRIMTSDERKSPDAIERMYNPVTMEDVRTRARAFPFADILDAHGASASRLINLQEPEWLAALDALYVPEELPGMKAYLIRRVATGSMGLLDEAAYRELQRLSRERWGIEESRPDEELAAQFVHSCLPSALSRLYVARHMSPDTKEDVSRIIRSTVEHYRTMLGEEEWLSPATRERAIEKLDALELRVGWPDKWPDEAARAPLEIGTKEDGETLLSAMEKLRRFDLDLWFRDKINAKVDRTAWISDVARVNAYYRPTQNAIMIIAGILSGDFYAPTMSEEEKLGGIGFVIGHEISHAFDTRGAQFDAEGNVASWWTEDDEAAFKARAERLISWLDGFVVQGQPYDGALVQTETIADMAGAKAMLGLASRRPGFDYDRFFRAYARAWRMAQTKERLDMALRMDVHALPHIRVNAVLQQFDEFHATYGIEEGDGMWLAPEDRVAVW